jgi:hypothetical protein
MFLITMRKPIRKAGIVLEVCDFLRAKFCFDPKMRENRQILRTHACPKPQKPALAVEKPCLADAASCLATHEPQRIRRNYALSE